MADAQPGFAQEFIARLRFFRTRRWSCRRTDIPARLDALPWSHFHTLVVVALGITWILDGLEVTLTGALAGVLKETSTLGLTN